MVETSPWRRNAFAVAIALALAATEVVGVPGAHVRMRPNHRPFRP